MDIDEVLRWTVAILMVVLVSVALYYNEMMRK